MNSLDDIVSMKTLDPSNVLGSTELFPEQCTQAWKESSIISYPENYKKASNIVVCGMGGSRFTPRTIKELYRDQISLPYEIVEDYTLPSYVNESSLVILSSYSGSTEEVVSCAHDALKRKAKLTAITCGGYINEFMQKNGFPYYHFNPQYNPCGQPRIGNGYLLLGHLGILQALGVLHIQEEEIREAINNAKTYSKHYQAEIPIAKNPAKELAMLLMDKHPFIITAEFLKGFGNGFANQINETAKLISDYRYISELNHHLLDGLKNPDTLHQNGLFIFFLSDFYSLPIQKRFHITADVVKKQHIATHTMLLSGKTKLSQVLAAFSLSGFTTFYLSMLNNVDPATIRWVTHLKDQLAK